MNSKVMRKSVIMGLIMAVAMVFTLPYLQVEGMTYGATNSEKKEYKAAQKEAKKKKKTGIYKIKGKYYLVKNKKIKTGFQTFKKKKYYFNKYGVLQQGKTVIKGHTYVMGNAGKAKAAKSVKKAVLKTNTTFKVGDEKMYFSDKGRGFYSVESKKGNKAVAAVMDKVTFADKDTEKAKLKKIYKYIQKNFDYKVKAAPDLSSSSWVGDAAYDMVKGKRPGGICYHYAAIAYLCAEALDQDAYIVTGTWQMPGSDQFTNHSWVEVEVENGDKEETLMLDLLGEDTSLYESKVTYHFFYKALTKGEGDCDYYLTVGDKTIKYKKS